MSFHPETNFNTKCIHGGQTVEGITGAINVPVFLTSTYAQTSPGQTWNNNGYEYSRCSNPTRKALEDSIASLESAFGGLAYSSGLAAGDAIMKMLHPGDEVISVDNLYGGMYRMFTKMYANVGIKFHFLNIESHIAKFEELINEKTKIVWLESPSNPMMSLVDLKACAAIIKNMNPKVLLVVDNTFATPYIQRPLEMGADIILHSATKYLGGHCDAIAGLLAVKDEAVYKQLHFNQYAGGAILGPHESFLILRGIKTLALRMERHCENGLNVAQFLEKHPKVAKVFYPGLPSFPQYALAKMQMVKGFGGMVSFTFKSAKKEDSLKFCENVKVFTLAESLGGIESLVNHPAIMTHASIPYEIRQEIGITDDMIRLSVGVEDIDDLLKDIDQALMACV